MTRTRGTEYIEWAKTRAAATFNLATSGVMNLPISELAVDLADLELSGPSWYGYEPLQQALARKCGVLRENIVAATGTSMANHLAMAALLERGDEVVIESPVYEPLVAVAEYLGASVKYFNRQFENGFQLDASEIERAVSNNTRLIVLTNLHNPTGAYSDVNLLACVREIASRVGSRVLIDEVYLEAMFDAAPKSCWHLGELFVATSSLTKAYGLSGLRCGWIIADAELAKKIWRLNDLFGVIPAHPAERLSVIALDRLDQFAERSKNLIARNRRLLNSFLDSRDDLDCVRPTYGTVTFPRLKKGSVDSLCTLLRAKYDTTVVPGHFFGLADHFRVGIGGDTDVLQAGLERLGSALDEMAR